MTVTETTVPTLEEDEIGSLLMVLAEVPMTLLH